uniref:Uncharacterized protein n=1 Tax=Anguilla anguilla TaxID=7936 RepID=A0A0E9TLR9_ANGAN
MSPSFRTELNL